MYKIGSREPKFTCDYATKFDSQRPNSRKRFNTFFTKDDINHHHLTLAVPKILSHFVREKDTHRNCVTNSIYTRNKITIVDYEEVGQG